MNDEEFHYEAIKIYAQSANDFKYLSEYISNYVDNHEISDDTEKFIENLCDEINKIILGTIDRINVHSSALNMETIKKENK